MPRRTWARSAETSKATVMASTTPARWSDTQSPRSAQPHAFRSGAGDGALRTCQGMSVAARCYRPGQDFHFADEETHN